MENLTVEYTQLLQKHRSIEAKEVLEFVDKHEDDEAFQDRVDTLNLLWLNFKFPEIN